ncbi:aldehyde dehydrogenase family protein [Aeromicrobium sp. CTD01-1L150]|uniref:aldehyde dehydrogenase family protein n=1 Tax=Aeromicrobium sp. CTD01-1L150 TaxID=3341830 RepID=UPI0035C236B0
MISAEVDKILDRQWGVVVGGTEGAGVSARTYEVENPATEEAIADVQDASPEDVDRAVRSASDASVEWAQWHPRDRGRRLRALADALREHTDELSLLDALDSGNPRSAMRNDVAWGADVLDLFADAASALDGDAVRASVENLHYTERAPFGVVARIVPFNHPIFFAAAKVAAPLMAGNSVVLKPSDLTPLSAIRLGEIAQDILPPGTMSVLTAQGPGAGRALVQHPLIRRIGFIGSEQVGRAIQADAASVGVKEVSLELGGKNALIACADADVAATAQGIVNGMNFAWSQGQSCGSTSRVLLQESIADEVMAAVVERVESLRQGNPVDQGTEMGPLASREQYDKSMRYIESAHGEGATLVTGGGRPAGAEFARGHYVQPTVFDRVTPDMRLAREEVFGPVMAVTRFSDEAEAVRIANALDFGLTASIWTRDVSRAIRLSRAVEAGYVWINGSSRHFWGMPFGGMKSSGIGREESIEELISYTELKAVNVLV